MRELERRVILSVLDRKWREHLYEMDYLREGISLRGYGQRDPLVEYQREGYDMFSAMMEGIKEESVGSLFNLQVQRQDSPIVEEAVPGGGAGGRRPEGGTFLAALAARWSADRAARRTGVVPGRGAAVRPTVRPAGSPAGQDATPGQLPRAPAGHARLGRGGPGRQPGAGGRAPGQEGPAVPAALARGLDAAAARPAEYSAPSDDGSGQAEQRAASAGGTDYSKVGRNAPCPCGSGRKFKQCHGDPRNR